jgi:hypothetical protein
MRVRGERGWVSAEPEQSRRSVGAIELERVGASLTFDETVDRR